MHQVRWIVAAIIGFSFIMSVLTAGISHVGTASLADVGAIGLSAGVAANEYNVLAGELQAKESDLATKENALNARELEILREKNAEQGLSSRYFLIGAALLFILVLVNLYFDFEILQAERRRPLPS